MCENRAVNLAIRINGQGAADGRGGNGSQNDRNETDHGIFGNHHFHGEDHASQGCVERGGDATGGAAGDEHSQAVTGQSQALPYQAVYGAAKVHARAFPAA